MTPWFSPSYVPEDVPLYTQIRVNEFPDFMGRSRDLQATVAAVAGLMFLIAMVVIGALPEQHQLVKFEARGV